MWNPQPLCINVLGGKRGLSTVEHIRLIKEIGWDAVFMDWNPAETDNAVEEAHKCGLLFTSIHAPFGHADKMWEEGDAGEAMTAQLLDCLDDCANHAVPVMVLHCYIGFRDSYTPTETGLARFGRVVEAAEKKGVVLGFENVEGEPMLEAVMTRFADCPAVGFCFDTGHRMCYNHGRDFMALYGDRLVCTHLNDNLGQRGPAITWLDDLHLPMGDGVADWHEIMHSIRTAGYHGPLTCELNYANKPNGHELDHVLAMQMDEFYAYALKKARFVAGL